MNSDDCVTEINWLPARGHQLRKTGVHFDAVRVAGGDGRRLAHAMAMLTRGRPGPIIAEANSNKAMYFLLNPGSTSGRSWPQGVTRLDYVLIPALYGATWPLSWWCKPTADGRLVHTLLLLSTARAFLGSAPRVAEGMVTEPR
ncbi:hypothetical protein B7P34_17625 [Streptosporangium nondiastaticum]|uniref:Uncharacterized protein n=2 Tax=Actinomycetes TaxID=1760 RepID=A0A9X7JPU3_9ACTN|nr:hypothetical protein [Streptosporangium nondiastaticum]PSJ27406.1 hypothetical protein B7P34_17625 [Streptosporangium nondiastaticum]